jgi:hypothetical protein
MRGIDLRLNVHASSFPSKGFTGCRSLPLSILIEVLSVSFKCKGEIPFVGALSSSEAGP